eukprot:GEMP01077610.1.p1 GENE.GEMP01077610.1~~GEMP01077610.1.p1  ORF type:complete len:275 (+),score=57.27 GEMP01077610.1:71-895(+)
MDKYRRVPKEKNTDKEMPDDEIRISATGRTAAYVTYAAKLFNENKSDKLLIKATGTALATAVTVTEIIKRRFKGLHQITHLGSTEIIDEYEPLEEGLDKVTDVRQVSFVEITLSKITLDETNIGYQSPISEDLVKELSAEDIARGRGGRKGSRSRKGKGKGKSKGRSGSSPSAQGKGKGKEKGGKRGKSPDRGRSESRGKDDKGKSKGGKGKASAYDGYSASNWYDDGYGSYGGRDTSKGKGKGKKGFEDKGKGKGKGKGGKWSKGGKKGYERE